MKISIVTVTYNSEIFLPDCLVSIETQSHEDIEHIVIDGASTDRTLEILSSRCGNLAALVSESDSGIYDAMNKGLDLARGDIVGFLNSDDLYANSHILERVANVFVEDPELEACYADLLYVDPADTSRAVRYWQASDFVPGSFARGWCPPHPTFFVRRSVYERYGNFDLSYKLAADYQLLLRFFETHKIRVRYVPEVWVKMRLGGTTNKSVSNVWKQNQEILRALRSHGLPTNELRFLGHKLVLRCKQFIHRPTI